MGGEADIHWRSKYPLEREISPWREIVTHSPWRGTSLVAESPGSHPYTHPPVTQPVPYVLQTDTHTYTHTHAHTHKFKYTHIMPCGGRCMVCTHKQPLEHFKITCMIQYLRFYFTSKKSLKINWKKKKSQIWTKHTCEWETNPAVNIPTSHLFTKVTQGLIIMIIMTFGEEE